MASRERERRGGRAVKVGRGESERERGLEGGKKRGKGGREDEHPKV